MKVSIIIPIYNVSKYIERCLVSALSQTWDELELILVNDCTPDDSMAIVYKILAMHPRKDIVTVLTHKQNRGLSAARNTGICKAIGDYVYFLDSDDYLPVNAIELLSGPAINYSVDFVVGNYEVKGEKKWVPPLLLDTCLLLDNKTILRTYSKDQWYVMAWNKLVNKSFLVQNNLFFKEGIIHEDDLWSFQLACKAKNAYVVNAITYLYSIQPNSITGNPSIRNIECRVFIIEYLFDFINTNIQYRKNRYIYILFEKLKVKYFDRILYFVKDSEFQYSSYLIFRKCKYISFLKAIFKFYPGILLFIKGFHYLMPKYVGYLYFRICIRFCYLFSVLPIKVDKLIRYGGKIRK